MARKPERQLNFDDAARRRQRDQRGAYQSRLNDLRYRLDSIDPALLAIGEHRWYTIRETVMAVASHDDQGGACRKTTAELAAWLGWTIGQWREALRHAKRLGVIRASRRYRPGRRNHDRLSIDEGALAELLARARRRRPDQVDPTRPKSNQVDLTRSTYREPSLPSVPKNQSSSSPPSVGAQQVVIGDPRWREVEEELLLSCRVNAAAKAVRGAIANGATADDVRRVIAWWRPRQGRWVGGEGGNESIRALYWRVRRALPGDDEATGWTGALDPHWRDPAAAVDRTRRAAVQAAQESAEAAAAEAAAADRERRHGAELDALSEEEVLALLDGQSVWLNLHRRGRLKSLVRDHLLGELETRAALLSDQGRA